MIMIVSTQLLLPIVVTFVVLSTIGHHSALAFHPASQVKRSWLFVQHATRSSPLSPGRGFLVARPTTGSLFHGMLCLESCQKQHILAVGTPGSVAKRLATRNRFPSRIMTGTTRIHQGTNKASSSAAPERIRPDPSILLSAKSAGIQRLGFLSIVALLVAGTFGMIQLINRLEIMLPTAWYQAWRDYTWPIPLGLLFTFVGVTHFTWDDEHCAMTPPRGTWGGLWQVPAPGAKALGLSYQLYHVYWTGVAEIVLGMGLVLSKLSLIAIPMSRIARWLFFLTIAVTPANIYMFTHDAQNLALPPLKYPEAHIIRGILQCLWLAMFWKLAHP